MIETAESLGCCRCKFMSPSDKYVAHRVDMGEQFSGIVEILMKP
jgi:hypothetical protein